MSNPSEDPQASVILGQRGIPTLPVSTDRAMLTLPSRFALRVVLVTLLLTIAVAASLLLPDASPAFF